MQTISPRSEAATRPTGPVRSQFLIATSRLCTRMLNLSTLHLPNLLRRKLSMISDHKTLASTDTSLLMVKISKICFHTATLLPEELVLISSQASTSFPSLPKELRPSTSNSMFLKKPSLISASSNFHQTR